MRKRKWWFAGLAVALLAAFVGCGRSEAPARAAGRQPDPPRAVQASGSPQKFSAESLVGTWKGHVEKHKAPDGFLGLLEKLELHLGRGGTAKFGQADKLTGQFRSVVMGWRLEDRKVVLFDPKNASVGLALALLAACV